MRSEGYGTCPVCLCVTLILAPRVMQRPTKGTSSFDTTKKIKKAFSLKMLSSEVMAKLTSVPSGDGAAGLILVSLLNFLKRL